MIIRPHSFLLDAKALSALARSDRIMQPWSAIVRRTDSTLHMSALTLTEVTDGSHRDVAIRRVCKTLDIYPIDASVALLAGKLRATATATRRKPRDLTVDAIVAATALALRPPVVVLTSDPADLRLLLSGTAIRIESIG